MLALKGGSLAVAEEEKDLLFCAKTPFPLKMCLVTDFAVILVVRQVFRAFPWCMSTWSKALLTVDAIFEVLWLSQLLMRSWILDCPHKIKSLCIASTQ